MNFAFKVLFFDIRWVDALDILLVALLLYQLYRLLRGSVALKIFIGILIFYLVYEVVQAAEMELLSNILGQFIGVGVIAALIVFQPEIRKFLLFVGRNTILNDNIWALLNRKREGDQMHLIPIIDAVKTMAGNNTGALIVFAGNSDLSVFVNSGDVVDAQISKRVLLSIFFKNSPLHDGAVIVKDNRVLAARCVLPVSDNPNLAPELGLRHRSALGLAEQTDAVVLVVSEETGQMSLAYDGKFEHNLSTNEIRTFLNQRFGIQPQKPVNKEPAESVSTKTQTITR